MKRKSFAPPLQILKKKINNSYPAHVAGFFFCLASAEGAGLLFCLAAYQPRASVCSGLYSIHTIIQPKRQNRLQGFTVAFPLICAIPAHTIQQIRKPPMHSLRHAGGHTVKRSTSSTYQIPPPLRTLYRSAQRPIIIKYIRVQRCAPAVDPCPAVQHIADHASPAGSAPTVCGSLASVASGAPADGSTSPPGRAVQQQGHSERAEPLAACRRISFRAFAR